jgi:ComF family protein
MTSTLGPIGRLLDLALPATCAGCGSEGDPLCATCRPGLDTRLALPPGTPLGLAEGPPEPLLQLEWCSPFAGVTRHALHALKYAGEQRLAGPLGLAVAARWRVAGAGGDLLVSVPVHAARRRERGYDQAELIADVAAGALGMPWRPALVRSRATVAQYRLDRRHRARNVRDAFELRSGSGSAPAVTGRWVVLVDDIVTTGATLVACADALLAAGAAAVSAVTVARER